MAMRRPRDNWRRLLEKGMQRGGQSLNSGIVGTENWKLGHFDEDLYSHLG